MKVYYTQRIPLKCFGHSYGYIQGGPLRRMGTAVAQWLMCFATNRKVAGSIPDGVIGIFH